jgi:hypothetical protein
MDRGGWLWGDTGSVRNLDVDKVGAADLLTGAIMVMANGDHVRVVEGIEHSRREGVDGSRLK